MTTNGLAPMPDAHYAMLQWTSALPPDACAIILTSVGHCLVLLEVNRMAVCSIPMKGIHRSNLSCRTLLFLFALLGTPMAARCDSLEDSAKELARKIAATLPPGENLHCEIRNMSSLGADDVDRIGRAFQGELQRPCNGGSDSKVSLVVTLSDNLENFVWTADVHQGSDSRTALLAVPHSEANPRTADAPLLNLSREEFWEGVERPLDADKVSTPKGDQLVVLLFGHALAVRNTISNAETRIALPIEIPNAVLREPSGTLIRTEKSVDVRVGRRNCTISLDAYSIVSCRDLDTHELHVDLIRSDAGQTVYPVTPCSKNLSWLVTGTGDDTQPDSLKIIEQRNLNEITVSNQLDFNGPIVAIHADEKFSRVIVRNLHTGNYEAYRVSISCGQ